MKIASNIRTKAITMCALASVFTLTSIAPASAHEYWRGGRLFGLGVLGAAAVVTAAVLTAPERVVAAPGPVAYYPPAPAYYAQTPVYYAPQPAYYAPAPAYYAPVYYGR